MPWAFQINLRSATRENPYYKLKILFLFNLAIFGRKYYSLCLRLVLCALSALEAWHADLILYVCCGLRLCFGFESGDKLHRELRYATVRVGPTSGSEL